MNRRHTAHSARRLLAKKKTGVWGNRDHPHSTLYLHIRSMHKIRVVSLFLIWSKTAYCFLVVLPALPPRILQLVPAPRSSAGRQQQYDSSNPQRRQRECYHRTNMLHMAVVSGKNNSSRRRRSSIPQQTAERQLHRRGFQYVIGSDEAGRGCIAGPVVVASCCMLQQPPNQDENEAIMASTIPNVNDSKLLSRDERRIIYQEILSQPEEYAWTISHCTNIDIGHSNIVKATMIAFQTSIETLIDTYQLPLNSTYSIVDGPKTPKLHVPVPCRPWIKGDSHVYTVALASILAKVIRDDYMKHEAHCYYPQYGFDVNAGYPTRQHIQAIHTYGPCPLHRMSFQPLKGR